jgi:DNA polymerase
MGRGSRLRDAIYCDEGYTLLVVDAKQIEARVTAWFCGQDDLVEQFRRGEDVYSNFASIIFGHTITSADKPQRFVGKTGILQLGYASGWMKFQNTVRHLSRDMDPPIVLSDDEAQTIVQKYRGRFSCIKWTWKELDGVLMNMHTYPVDSMEGMGHAMKCVTFYRNTMVGPTGLPIHFPGLHYREEDGSWWFSGSKGERRTYGASLLETIAQHISRCIVMSAAVRLRTPMAGLGARLVHTAHDELVYRVPVQHLETAKIWAQTEMNRPPPYAPDLPLDCDIGVAVRYGDCK